MQAETLDFTDPSIGWPFQMIFRMSTILLPIGEDNNGMVQAILLGDLRPLDPFSYGTVNYVDEDGKQIHESVLFMGQTGTDYDLTSYVIPMEGFTPDKVKNDKVVHGNFSKGGDNGNVTLTYYKNDSPPIVKLITVKYEDSSGKEIHPSQNITGSYGESYDVSTDKYKLDLSDEGYVLDESQLPDNTKGIFTDQPQEIVYKYKSITSKITLNYKDELGNEIRTPITITGRKGQAYDFTVSSDETKVEGYQLDVEKLPTNAKGKFTDTDQTITLIYKSDAPASGFIEVPQAIRLHGLVEAGQKIVGAKGVVKYHSVENTPDKNIEVATAPKVTITATASENLKTNHSVDVSVYHSDGSTPVIANTPLGVLTKDQAAYEFYLKAPQNKFKSEKLNYNGTMSFTVKFK